MFKLATTILLALCVFSCALPKGAPNLVIVKDRAQIGGNLGIYSPGSGTIYLAPGANWDVLQHELDHHYFGSLGEDAK